MTRASLSVPESDALSVLASWEELDRKATRAPWIPMDFSDISPLLTSVIVYDQSAVRPPIAEVFRGTWDGEANAAFIAAARTGWPAAVRALKVYLALPCVGNCCPQGSGCDTTVHELCVTCAARAAALAAIRDGGGK